MVETAQGNWDLRIRASERAGAQDDSKHEGDMAWFDNIHPNDRGTAVLADLFAVVLTKSR